MDKLFVNVADKNSAAYYIEHFTGDSDDHSMDDKIAFLQSETQIVTKHSIFDGKKITINANANSFIDKNGSTITLNISDTGELSLDMYTASKFLSTSVTGKGTTGQSGTKYVTYGSSIDTTISAYTGNNTTYSISHGTNNIILTGIKVSYDSTSAYIYGGETIIENGEVTYINNIGYIPRSYYVNSDINGSCKISNDLITTKSISINTNYIKGKLTNVATASQQYVDFYYHELGQDNLHSQSNICSSSISLTYDVTYAYCWGVTHISQEALPIIINGYSNVLPSPISIDSSDVEGKEMFAYVGMLKKFGKQGVTEEGALSEPKAFEFADNETFINSGGWLFVKYIDMYSCKDFAVYRTTNSNLGQKTWYIRPKE